MFYRINESIDKISWKITQSKKLNNFKMVSNPLIYCYCYQVYRILKLIEIRPFFAHVRFFQLKLFFHFVTFETVHWEKILQNPLMSFK